MEFHSRALGDRKLMRSGNAPQPIKLIGPHEAWLVRALLRRTVFGQLHQEVSAGLRAELSPRQRGKRVIEEREEGRRFLNGMSMIPRSLLAMIFALMFIPVTIWNAWDSWGAEFVLALLALMLLGLLVIAVRMMLLPAVSERHARFLEPWNGDVVWQGIVVSGVWLLLSLR